MCISNLFPLSFPFFIGTKPFSAPHQRNSFHVHLVSPFNKDKVPKIKKRVLNLSQTKKFKGRGGKMKGAFHRHVIQRHRLSSETCCTKNRYRSKEINQQKARYWREGCGKGEYLPFFYIFVSHKRWRFFPLCFWNRKNYPTEFNFYNIKEHLCLTCGYSEKNNCFRRRKTSVELENNCFYTLKTERLFHI